jgi:large-conductance mechanosensitive channel
MGAIIGFAVGFILGGAMGVIVFSLVAVKNKEKDEP